MNIEQLEERINDAQTFLVLQQNQIKDLEKLLNKIPDYGARFDLIEEMLRQSMADETLIKVELKLDDLEKQISELPKTAKREIRILLFPEFNPGEYYRIVFGRVIPWGILLIALIFGFFLGKGAIEAQGNVRENQTTQQYAKAWLYLNDHSSKKVKKEIVQAWEKSSKGKDK